MRGIVPRSISTVNGGRFRARISFSPRWNSTREMGGFASHSIRRRPTGTSRCGGRKRIRSLPEGASSRFFSSRRIAGAVRAPASSARNSDVIFGTSNVTDRSPIDRPFSASSLSPSVIEPGGRARRNEARRAFPSSASERSTSTGSRNASTTSPEALRASPTTKNG